MKIGQTSYLNTCTVSQSSTPLGGYQGQHTATRTTLALLGKAFYPSGTPPMLIPNNAFVDVQVWHAATEDEITTINATQTDLLAPSGQNVVMISHIIPLPPFLVPFFLNNTDSPLIQICKKFCTKFTMANLPTYQACTLICQFLLAAVTLKTMAPNSTHSQVAIALMMLRTHNIIA